MENQIFFYGLFTAILGFLFFIFKMVNSARNSVSSNSGYSIGNRSLIHQFKENADKILIDLNQIEFRHQTNEKESFDFKPFERDILLEPEKSKRYLEYKNRGVITFNYKNRVHKHLVRIDNIPEKSLLIYLYQQKQTYLYIDKNDFSKRYLDLDFLEIATEGKFQQSGIEYIDLENYDLQIKNSIYG